MIDADETTRDADEAARDFDVTNGDSMVLDDNCENSNDSNKGKIANFYKNTFKSENVPVATAIADEPVTTITTSPDTRSSMTTRRSLEFSKMGVEPSSNEVLNSKEVTNASNMDSSSQKTSQEAPESLIDDLPSKLVKLEEIWSPEELAQIRSEAEKKSQPILIDADVLDKIFQMACDISSGRVLEDIMQLGAAMNTVIYRYK